MSEKILIVDDDVDSLKVIGLMLQRHGYEVVAANAGNPALAKAEAEQPDLIILDVMMPDMNGLEVCRRLRANDSTKDIPIIMFTAKTLIDDKVKGFEAGADDYLTKPTHPAELASRVKAILSRNQEKAPDRETPASSPAKKQGLSIGVLGAKGGVGTTTVALNIASALLESGQDPILAEFRPGAGTLGQALGFDAPDETGMTRLLTDQNINDDTIADAIVTHESGLRIIASPATPLDAQADIRADTGALIASSLRQMANPVVFDLGCQLDRRTMNLLAEVDKLVMVLEPNPIALQHTYRQIKAVEQFINEEQISIVVVNRTQTNLQTPWHEIENKLGREVKAIISAAPEVAFQAIQNEMPMVLLQPDAIITSQFTKLADDLKSRIRSIAN